MSDTYNIFDIDNLVLEFSNSNLNASLVTTDYSTDKGAKVGLARVGMSKVVKVDKKIKNGLKVRGNTTSEKDNLNLVWYTKDIYNHGYCRYTTQKSLAGTVIRFKISLLENVVPYTDIFDIQYLTIIDNKNKEYKVEFASLGNIVSFDIKHTIEEEIKAGDILPIEHCWISKDKNLSIKYFNSEDELKELLIGVDFDIDYKKGLITFLKDNILSVDTEIRIRGYRYSDEEFTIKFSTLRDINNEVVVVDDIKCVKFPITIEESIGKGNTFLYQLIDVEITRGGQTWLHPTDLKKHNIELCENYTYTRGLNPRRLIYNIEKLGYKDKLILHLGDGEFFNLDYKEDKTTNIFNTGFSEWYKDLINHSTYKGFSEIDIVIPMYNKYLLSYCQQIYNGNTIKILNPILNEVQEYIKDIMKSILDISFGISVKFIIEGLQWGKEDNSLGIYNYETISLYKSETKKDYINDFENIVKNKSSDEALEFYKWFSSKLLDFIKNISSISEVNLMVNTNLLYSNDYHFNINDCFGEYLNYTSNIYLVNTTWDNPKIEANNLLNRAKEVFQIETIEPFIFCINGIDTDLLLNKDISKKWDYITNSIEVFKYELGLDVLIMAGMSIRLNSYFLFNPLAYVELSTITTNHDIALCKVNKTIISNMYGAKIESIKRKVDDIDEIQIEIPYYIQDRFTHKRIKNFYYDEVKTERLIMLNNKEYFVIKEVKEELNKTLNKVIRCYSLEHKLSKRPVVFSFGQSLQLYSDDTEQQDGILNYLEQETGWKVGYINEECRFELSDGVLKTKYRYFEEINTNWYSFLMDEISELFDCLFQFNTGNKTINVYPNTVLGADSGLFLTEDNYIKSLERVDTTNEIVTRLSLIGRDDINIYEVNPLGTDYIENFDYFIENGEMSKELVEALKTYYILLEDLFNRWTNTNNEYLEKKNLQSIYDNDITLLQVQIDNWIKIRDEYDELEDEENYKNAQDKIDSLSKEKETILALLNVLNIEVPKLKKELFNLSLRMSRETMLNTNGELLFTDNLLNELQEFIYHDTYDNSNYMEPQSLMDCGIRVLKDMSRPTSEYTIDIVNFIDRVRHNRMWQGVIHLRDVITLKSEKNNKEVDLFIVGFNYSPKDKTIEIELSNKISTKSSIKTIAEILKISKETSKLVNLNKYLWAKQKKDIQNVKNKFKEEF